MSVVISEQDGSRHETNATDALWLARALDGEGGDERAVAATLLQRWVMLGGSRWGTLGELAQLYCQAISPGWLAQGQHCRPGGVGHGTSACSEQATARREARRRKRWADIRQDARDAAIWALYSDAAGSYLPASVHYATRELVARKMGGATATREGWEVIARPGIQDGHSYVSTTASREGAGALRVVPGQLHELNALGRAPSSEVVDLAPMPITASSGGDGALMLFGALGLGLGAVALASRRGRRYG